MNGQDFYKTVKEEELDKLNIGDSEESHKAADFIGVAEDDGWIVFETDERASFHILSKHESQEEAYDALLSELRSRKRRKEEIPEKLRRK